MARKTKQAVIDEQARQLARATEAFNAMRDEKWLMDRGMGYNHDADGWRAYAESLYNLALQGAPGSR